MKYDLDTIKIKNIFLITPAGGIMAKIRLPAATAGNKIICGVLR